MSETWTIGELARRATDVLRSRPQLNGRVRDVPSERLIRWYTTIGLVDPPLARHGRVAVYGHRHLMQLVAIKHRQAAGRTIAEIQVELAGATDAALATVAELPHEIVSGPPRAAPVLPETGVQPEIRFWTRRPAADPGPAADAGRVDPWPVHGVGLTPEVTLLLGAAHRPLSGDDMRAIAAAARPLLDVLKERGLRTPDDPDGGIPA
ncbi:MAG TPA: MerR family transcriptional regulator [Thermopolyspora sp.]|jgi:Predicted transcriptional regulators